MRKIRGSRLLKTPLTLPKSARLDLTSSNSSIFRGVVVGSTLAVAEAVPLPTKVASNREHGKHANKGLLMSLVSFINLEKRVSENSRSKFVATGLSSLNFLRTSLKS
jgi:hypothetical protein